MGVCGQERWDIPLPGSIFLTVTTPELGEEEMQQRRYVTVVSSTLMTCRGHIFVRPLPTPLDRLELEIQRIKITKGARRGTSHHLGVRTKTQR